MASKPVCGNCYYLWWHGMKRGCFHPENARYLQAGPQSCKNRIDHDMKVVDAQWWPKRLSIDEFIHETKEQEDDRDQREAGQGVAEDRP